MTDGKPLVLYITGMMRCGSTFVGNILNEMPGALHIGERYFLWKNALLRDGTNTLCGCGLDLLKCEIWADQLRSSDGDAAGLLWSRQQRHLRTRHFTSRLRELRGRRAAPAEVEELGRAIGAIHHRIVAGHGTRLIIDSSKSPADAALLARRSDLDVRFLHMVRDPRATVASYLSPKDYLKRMSASRTLSYWTGFNLASEALGLALPRERYLRIRYEDFTRHPRAVIDRISRFAGYERASAVPFESESSVVLGANHTITGNPDRLQQGEVAIKQRERWRETMPRKQQLAVAASAAPLMIKYGYVP